VARRLECEAELASVMEIIEEGPSYARQRALVAAGGSLEDVVDALIEELRTDAPALPRSPAPEPEPAAPRG